ncbi:MAG: DUF1015 domain-containing protein [Pyrinomonadaceae bacterium]|nr:DUF1015 domain-containing protein [Phycisphaerales bacterium]
MPNVFPFRAVQYAKAPRSEGALDVSDLVAPPYDVLDASSKGALLQKNARNMVGIDLPHIPAKELGPAAAYDGAAAAFRAWLADGTMARREAPVMFVYRETFQFAGKQHQRTGMACTIDLLPFGARAGGGILPHEETFSGPKEDRFALMKASNAQFSPIFGLHQDEHGKATTLLTDVMKARKPDVIARTSEGFGGPVLHEIWTIENAPTIAAYAEALKGQDIFIADGHHRYTTALNYLKQLETSGPVAMEHPARKCLIVLVGMSDPGMVIGPTHRVLAGMSGYTFEAFEKAAAGKLVIKPVQGGLAGIEAAMHQRLASESGGVNVLGLHDFATNRSFTAMPSTPDPLATRFPAKVQPWRQLDVAIVQYLIVEDICQPALNAGNPVQWAFPHSIQEVIDIGAGKEKGSGGGKAFTPQLAVIVRPTPLESVRAVSRAGELMPQKSTFFYPKLATGLFINVVE